MRKKQKKKTGRILELFQKANKAEENVWDSDFPVGEALEIIFKTWKNVFIDWRLGEELKPMRLQDYQNQLGYLNDS